ncbi:MAG: AAA domain-containing protein [Acidiferrobacterales bacterium]
MQTPSDEILSELVKALNLDIEAIKQQQGRASAIEVYGGEYRGTAEGNVLYAFPVTDEFAVYLHDESPIQVVVGKERADGSVVSLDNGILLIAVERNLGPTILVANLICDSSLLVERLKAKLEALQEHQTSFNYERAEQVIGKRLPRTDTTELDIALAGRGHTLNREQSACIQKALASEITYVWGPPGTGKTTVLARIAQGYYRKGLSVLVIANTNMAVDTALLKIAERLEGDAGFETGAVVRLGPVIKEELANRYGDYVDLDRVVARRGQQLREEKERLAESKGQLEAAIASLRAAIEKHNTLAQAMNNAEPLQAQLAETQARVWTAQQNIERLADRIGILRRHLDKARGLGPVRRFLRGSGPDRLEAELRELETDHDAWQETSRVAIRERPTARAELERARQEVKRLEAKVSGQPPPQECRRRLAPIEMRLASSVRRLEEIQKHLDGLQNEVLGKCRILATTVHRTYLEGQVERYFDAVVIDEASVLMIPMVYYVAGHADRHVLVAGDFRQLPPIAQSDAPEALEWLKDDIFHSAGIVAAVRRHQSPTSLVALKTQYRMHQDICSVVNRLFYHDLHLETPRDLQADYVDEFPWKDNALLYVDTAPYHPWAGVELGKSARYNLLHALLMRNLAVYLASNGYLDAVASEGSPLGIVSPFAAQTRLIQRLINERLPGRGAQIAQTAYRFQDNERNTMLIDFTESFGVQPSKFASAFEEDDEGARLLNAALSRARRHVVLVANFEYVRSELGADSIPGRILELFEANGKPLDVKTLLPLGAEEWIEALKPTELPIIEFDSETSGIFTEITFDRAFLEDLKHMKKSAVIFSPHMSEQGTGRWLNLLAAKVNQGVCVRLVTRPPENQGGTFERNLEQLLRVIMDCGVIVDLRQDMHEKFAIIDNTVLWHGSLNILSHRDTKENVLRIHSPATCRLIARYASTPTQRTAENEEAGVGASQEGNPETAHDVAGLW